MQTVLGVFDDRSTAQRAVERLADSGFDRDDIHLESAGDGGTLGIGATAGVDRIGGTLAASGSGGTDALGRRGDEDPGVMASIGDFFSRLFGGDDDSQPRRAHGERYAEAVRRGSCVVVVDARDADDAERAADVMSELGAVDIDARSAQWRTEGWTGSSYVDSATPPSGQQMMVGGASVRPQAAQDASERSDLQDERRLDVVQEDLEVGKRTVDRGGVRVVQRVSEQPVREIVRLREEHAVVERRKVDRDATDAELSMGQDVVVEVREKVEEPVVSRRARVVEEVVVGKEVRERDETVNETVRRQDVAVERLGDEAKDATRRNREHAEAARGDKDQSGSRRSEDDLGTGREPKDLRDRRKP